VSRVFNKNNRVGAWRSLVAHLHGVQGVPSSNLGAPTNKNKNLVVSGSQGIQLEVQHEVQVNADATILAMFVASRDSHRMQVQIATECERQTREAAHLAAHASTRASNLAGSAALFADWNLGALDARIPRSLGLSSAVLNVFSTARTRHHVARNHPGDVEFITQQIVHALAHPYMYRRSEQSANRIELVGFAADNERTLRIILEAPSATPPEKGAHGWLKISATRCGKATRQRAERKGGWTRA
jgi:hypothetical protein